MCCWLLCARAQVHADAEGHHPHSDEAARLFDQGKQLLAARDYAQACAKLEQSQQLDPQLGTQLHLALCYEKQGLLASAHKNFQAAAELAAQRTASGTPEPREQIARKHLESMAPQLSMLRLQIAGSAPSDLRIELDGRELTRDAWSEPIPIDPGAHGLSASAPEHKPWKQDFTIGIGAQRLTLDVPALERVPPLAAAPAPQLALQPEPEPPAAQPPAQLARVTPNKPVANSSMRRVAGYAVAGAGVAGIGLGVVLGLVRNTKLSQLETYCDLDARQCTIAAGDTATRERIDSLRDSAQTAATAATLSFVIGGAALVGGLVLVLTARDSRSDVALQVGPGSLTLHGRVNGL